MLGVKFQPESQEQVALYKQQLAQCFANRRADEMYDALKLYDNAYMTAREYFAHYFAMGTETIINYVNSNKFGFTWEFLKNAVFDEGINALCCFYGKRSGKNNSKYEHILEQCEKAFGEEISSKNDPIINEILKYRHNNAAHCGNGFHQRSTSIKYDSPLEALEKLRYDRAKFDREKMTSGSTLYDENLYEYFCSKIKVVAKVLGNATVDANKIASELEEYMSSILS